MKNLLLTALLFLASCSAIYSTITDKTSKLGEAQGLRPKIYQTQNFKIYTLQRINDLNKKVRIYFEGDGNSYIQKHITSPNPTPTSYFLINLLAQDHSTNLVYIARPCQFLEDDLCFEGSEPEKYWTNDRFSKEVLDSINEVLEDFAGFEIEMVGYSGGATIMKHSAFEQQKKHKNILNLRSIAGNLDNQKFSEIHGFASEPETIDEKELFGILKNIPQIHFTAKNDEIVPPIIAQTYVKKLQQKNCAKIISIAAASHCAGWQEIWDELLKIEPICEANKK
jgi:hypothetical protein